MYMYSNIKIHICLYICIYIYINIHISSIDIHIQLDYLRGLGLGGREMSDLMYIYIYLDVHVFKHKDTHMSIHMHIHIHIHMHIHIHIHIHISSIIHIQLDYLRGLGLGGREMSDLKTRLTRKNGKYI
jgi:hypothetical protein